MVHHETTTGRLNPVTEIADLCARHGVRLLLDAVSSFGAEDIPFSHPALEACAGTANKCLHGIPGLAFVLCREAALQAGARRSLSLHLPDWAARQQAGSTPYTPAVPAVLALQQALAELAAQGGAQARRARDLQLADAVRHTLLDLGVTPWLPPEESSCVLRSYRLPAGVAYNSVHAALKRDGFIIYEGQGGLAQEMFRISTMGDITDGDAERLQASLVKVFGG
jgi:2-aminoethylphosphonate-pyruvate transaminase